VRCIYSFGCTRRRDCVAFGFWLLAFGFCLERAVCQTTLSSTDGCYGQGFNVTLLTLYGTDTVVTWGQMPTVCRDED
jgi:hypothetical protein